MQVQMRKDAVRSRRAILDAARQLYDGDAEASFAAIAHHAGVGQATVYRHFADRQALVAELAEEDMDRLEERFRNEPIGPGSLEELLRELVAEQVRSASLIGALRAGEVQEGVVGRLIERTLGLLAPRLEAAHAAGLVRADLTPDDLMIVLAMIDGALAQGGDHAGREAIGARVLEIAMDGLRSES